MRSIIITKVALRWCAAFWEKKWKVRMNLLQQIFPLICTILWRAIKLISFQRQLRKPATVIKAIGWRAEHRVMLEQYLYGSDDGFYSFIKLANICAFRWRVHIALDFSCSRIRFIFAVAWHPKLVLNIRLHWLNHICCDRLLFPFHSQPFNLKEISFRRLIKLFRLHPLCVCVSVRARE